MKRKIVQHGPSTLIISLPSSWIKQNGIKKGDELDVKEEGKTLVIYADISLSKNLFMSQDISELNQAIVGIFLTRIYQKGYDKVHLIHNNISLLKKVQEKVLELIGYEIIEQDDKYCLIQSISSNIELDFDSSLRKAFLISKQMLETCLQAYRDSDNATLQSLYIKNFELRRFCNFCLRQINKEQYVGLERSQQSHVLYYLIELLAELGESYTRLSRQLAEDKKPHNQLMNLLRMLLDQFETAYTYFYKSSTAKANEAYELLERIEKDIEGMIATKLSPSEIFSIYIVMDASRIIHRFITMRLDMLKENNTNSMAFNSPD